MNKLESEPESESRVWDWNRNWSGIKLYLAGIGIRDLSFPGIGTKLQNHRGRTINNHRGRGVGRDFDKI